MSPMTGRLWSLVLVPLPVAGVCITCYTWRLGFSTDVLAPVSLAAVCALTFVIGWKRRPDDLRGRGRGRTNAPDL